MDPTPTTCPCGAALASTLHWTGVTYVRRWFAVPDDPRQPPRGITQCPGCGAGLEGRRELDEEGP
jgi:hypothetical protein